MIVPCNKPWLPNGESETSETIEWEVRMIRRRANRRKFRRPDDCTCDDGRPDIVCAPAPPALIPNGLLGISFIVQALLLKFLDLVPMNRILGMAAREGMPLSAGTLCGVFEKITPLFLPLYEAISARSRQEDLVLMDKNGAERAARPAAVARKNFYGSGSKWSGQLLAMLMSLLQTLRIHRIEPRAYLTAYLEACASHGSKAPKDITHWLPWNFVPPEIPAAQDLPQRSQPQGPAP